MTTELIPGSTRGNRGRDVGRTSLIRTDGPVRLLDNGEHLDELPDGRDFIGFGEGQR